MTEQGLALRTVDAKFEVLGAPVMVVTAKQALIQREQLTEYIREQLKENVDYGKSPGTDKDVLLQPGADKLLNLYGLFSRMVCADKIERWDEGSEFFMYRYKCQIVWVRRMEDGSMREEVISESEGSCNSRESKYAYRWMKKDQLGPHQLIQAERGELVTQGRPEWVIEFKLKEDATLYAQAVAEKWATEMRVAKSGKTFPWFQNPHSMSYRVRNIDICDQVNTLQKMAQKRAYVAATIKATKASDLFTQDMEDAAENEAVAKGASTSEKGSGKASEAPKAEEAKKAPEAAPMAQNGAQDGNEKPVPVADAGTGEVPDEEHLTKMFNMAANEAQVLEAWALVVKHQAALGMVLTKKMRDLRDAKLKPKGV